MSRILITGAAGFIGSHICEALLGRGDEVVAVDNLDEFYSPEIKRRNLEAAARDAGFRLFLIDIRDESSLDRVFAETKPEAVIHLAARAGVRDSIASPEVYVDINVSGTLNVLEVMRRHGVRRLIFASSSSVYGGVDATPYRESGPVQSICPYAATKIAGEALCAAYAAVWDIRTICCRFFTVYGPRQRPDMAITRFTRQILAHEPITVFGDGSSARDYTFVRDIVRGVIAALDIERSYEIVNLGSTTPIPLMRLIAVLSETLGISPELRFTPAQPGEPLLTMADVTKASALLGYEPRTHFDAGIREFVDWYLSVTPSRIRQPITSNHKFKVVTEVQA